MLKIWLHHFLPTFKVINVKKRTPSLPYDSKFLEKWHHPCLIKAFINPEKRLHHFLMTPKAFNIEKGLHHFLDAWDSSLKLLILKNDSITFSLLLTKKFFKIAILQNVGEEPLEKVTYHITYLWLTNFTCSEFPIL